MAQQVVDFVKLIESHAPVSYKEDYDNVGLMVGDSGEEVRGILFSMDTTMKVIDEAIEKGANLIVSHHPMLFMRPDHITMGTLQGKKIIKLIKNGINVYAAHTNLDSVKGGMNDTIVRMFDYLDFDIIEQCEFDHDSGIGRMVFLRRSVTLREFIEKTMGVLGVENLRYSGDLDKMVRRVAIINGSGQSYIHQALGQGADCILTGDTTYHHVQELEEMGIAVIDPGHFASEQSVFFKIMKGMAKEFVKESGIPIYFSEAEKDPYAFYCKS